jgi:hypothetical protein
MYKVKYVMRVFLIMNLTKKTQKRHLLTPKHYGEINVPSTSKLLIYYKNNNL